MTEHLLQRRIVTIGGGSGGFVVNRGLVQYPVAPTAICTVFDNGGSTGKLRDEFGSLPQGDIRRCMLALADGEYDTLRAIFNHRFNGNGKGLSEHNVGNVLLLAAEQLWGPIEGIQRVSKLLGTKGQILPISVDAADLIAELSDRSLVRGEAAIDTRSLSDKRSIVRVALEPEAFIAREAAEAIKQAEVIVLGPGDLYTSLIPNFLVKGVAESIRLSGARVVYVCNIMTKYAETNGFGVIDFVETLFRYHIGRDLLDAIIVNSAPIPDALQKVYADTEKAFPVRYEHTMDELLSLRAKQVVVADVLSEPALNQSLVRHDSAKLARVIIAL